MTKVLAAFLLLNVAVCRSRRIITEASSTDSALNLLSPSEEADVTSSGGVAIRSQAMGPPSDLNIGIPGDFEDLPNLLHGDIRLEVDNQLQETRKGTLFDFNLWPVIDNAPTVHYRIGTAQVQQSTIAAAIAHYEQNTCLRFKETGFLHLGTRVNFDTGDGCSSHIGRQWYNFLGGQGISLARGCDQVRIVVHEIGHAIGLFHEQSRSDRDGYVQVLTGNIKTNRRFNFNREFLTRNYDTTYDFYSVMQYGPLSFTSNGETTLSAKDPFKQGLMVVNRTGLSFMDKLLVNRMYGCIKLWETNCINSDPCQNLGYIGPDCVCVCPEGTSGTNCQNKTLDYEDALEKRLLPLNELINTTGNVRTPGYPIPKKSLVIFTKIVEAPSCDHVVLTVVGFSMVARSSGENRCLTEGVELRLGDPVTSGKWYCGNDLQTGQVLKSETNKLVLFYIRSLRTDSTYPGFSFDMTFENNPNCTKKNY